jgi:hypothetical protein
MQHLSMIFALVLPKSSNQNTGFVRYSILIGRFFSSSMKLILNILMNASPSIMVRKIFEHKFVLILKKAANENTESKIYFLLIG